MTTSDVGVPAHRLARTAGTAIAPAFALGARLRRAKPLHPRGVVLDATVHRRGSRRAWGAAWLDEPGTDAALVRFSRAVGLPRPLPDVMGLALRFATDDGTHDLLLATTGLGRATRWLLLPRRRADRVPYTSLVPYRSARCLVLLAAVPVPGGGRPGDDRVFALHAAAPARPWEPFAELRVHGWPGRGDDPVAFDPVRHPLPGLAVPPAVAGLREPAYAAARRGRGVRLP